MRDRFTLKQRSSLMSKIKSKETRFELSFISILRKRTRRKFETHVRDVFGTPDIAFRKDKVCIFLDSDFWHGWYFPKWKNDLKNDYWREKIGQNRIRDKKVTRRLRSEGWTVFRFWEHDLKSSSPDLVISELLKRLDANHRGAKSS